MAQLLDELISYTEDKIIKQTTKGNIANGTLPYYPMVLFHVGEKSLQTHSRIIDTVFGIWPQFKSVIKSIYVDDNGKYFEINNESSLKPIDDIIDIFDDAFEDKKPYRSFNKLIANFIVDTSGIEADKFVKYKGIIDGVKDEIKDSGYYSFNAIYVLVNERGRNKKNSEEIKKELINCKIDSSSTYFILSNRLHSNNVINPVNDDRLRITGLLIVLSDDGNDIFLGRKLLTVKYASLKKDYRDITYTTIKNLLRYVNDIMQNQKHMYSNEDILEKVGLSKQGGLFSQLDELILSKHIDLSQLFDVLPRSTIDDLEYDLDLRMTEREINDITLGAFNALIDYKIIQIANDINRNSANAEGIKEKYANYLLKEMNVYELVYIYQNFPTIKKRINSNLHGWIDTTPIGQVINTMFLYYASRDERVNGVFFDTLYEVGKRAYDSECLLNDLLNDVSIIPIIKDDKVKDVYGKVVQEYLNNHINEVEDLFKTISSEEIVREIKNILDNIVDLPIYKGDLLDMIKNMVNADSDVAIRYIWNDLCDVASQRQYLKTMTELTNPIFSTIMIKKGTDLQKALENSLEGEYEFYNTGLDDAIDALQIFNVEKDDLVFNYNTISEV